MLRALTIGIYEAMSRGQMNSYLPIIETTKNRAEKTRGLIATGRKHLAARMEEVQAMETDRPDLKRQALAYGRGFEASFAVEEKIVNMYEDALFNLERNIVDKDWERGFGLPAKGHVGERVNQYLRERFDLRSKRRETPQFAATF